MEEKKNGIVKPASEEKTESPYERLLREILEEEKEHGLKGNEIKFHEYPGIPKALWSSFWHLGLLKDKLEDIIRRMERIAERFERGETKKLVSLVEAGKIFSVSPSTIRKNIYSGHIRAYKIGGQVRINIDEVLRKARMKLLSERQNRTYGRYYG